MSGETHSFRGHCASALTHPVTIAALVLLLLNDALFKSLWPDSWVTGKLSDLAWVVFASPLLAFVLSLFLGHRPFTRRAMIIIAYVGLPALYAAFNAFEPVHDRILWGCRWCPVGRTGRRSTRPTRWSFHLDWELRGGYGAGQRLVRTG